MDVRFPLQVVAALVIAGGAASYPLVRYGSEEIIRAVIAGGIISTINALLGYVSIAYSVGKPHTTFLKAVLGGMTVRMLAMLGVLVILIKVAEMHAAALIVSMLGFYLIYMILEVLFVQKRMLAKN